MRLGSRSRRRVWGLRLCSPKYRLIAAWRSNSDWKTPRRGPGLNFTRGAYSEHSRKHRSILSCEGERLTLRAAHSVLLASVVAAIADFENFNMFNPSRSPKLNDIALTRLHQCSRYRRCSAARLAHGRSGFGQRLRWRHSPLQAVAAGSCSANPRADVSARRVGRLKRRRGWRRAAASSRAGVRRRVVPDDRRCGRARRRYSAAG